MTLFGNPTCPGSALDMPRTSPPKSPLWWRCLSQSNEVSFILTSQFSFHSFFYLAFPNKQKFYKHRWTVTNSKPQRLQLSLAETWTTPGWRVCVNAASDLQFRVCCVFNLLQCEDENSADSLTPLCCETVIKIRT